MHRKSILLPINKLSDRVFTTREIAMRSEKSLSVATQSLNSLARRGVVTKLCRGVWVREGEGVVSPYAVIPHLFPRYRAYISFITALHLHGIIEQIPQVVTLASAGHSRIIRTKIGVFQAHHIAPSFFAGFGWYKGTANFLIAEPEKALVDSLYLSVYKKKQFGHFPELHFPRSFSFKLAREWAEKINSLSARIYVKKKLEAIRKGS